MRRVAHSRKGHPIVRQLALNVLKQSKVKSHDYVNEARAIGEYVKNKVRYVRDVNGMEQLHDPLTLIDQIVKGSAQGDCDDVSLLIATLLLSIGHSPFFRIVKYNPKFESFNHIYVVEYEKNGKSARRRVALDAILKNKMMGTEVPHKFGKEIKV